MPISLEVLFAPLSTAPTATTVVLSGSDLTLGSVAAGLDKTAKGAIMHAARAADFKGKAKAAIEILAPVGLDLDRLIVLGTGEAGAARDWVSIGAQAYAQAAARRTKEATVIADLAAGSGEEAGRIAADLALGALLRAYEFRKYLTRGGDNGGSETRGPDKLSILTSDPAGARTAFTHAKAVADGVALARDLVNEPANVLDPEEFARRTQALTKVGVDVEVLDVPALEALKMGALLGVAQGSVKPARVVVMQWHGTKGKKAAKAAPLCFVGKGVTFDTGGISIKPAAGMEDMKGDMGGAAAVTGLMLALAGRKAPVNAVGIIGLVENMPSGSAQRPGDIVTSMSGQTIEVLNTDAEGRLVLADVIWYAQERFKPKFVVNLATLTGAIMVALGKEHAGLFANDDKLAADLLAAGEATAEKVWRMPLGSAYDKLIDSKTADMKNIGGRFGGAITGAQFIQRFVQKGTAWAHLDIAGVAMDSNKTDVSQGWASGWGVRLLDRLVSDHHEKAEK